MIEWYKKVVFENYANFEGRARRSEYWYFTLANLIILFFLIIMMAALFAYESEVLGGSIAILLIVYVAATIIPSLAVLVRRLHDINKSGYYYFVSWIPYIGNVWIIILMCTEGTSGLNHYGPDPKRPYDEIDEIGENENI